MGETYFIINDEIKPFITIAAICIIIICVCEFLKYFIKAMIRLSHLKQRRKNPMEIVCRNGERILCNICGEKRDIQELKFVSKFPYVFAYVCCEQCRNTLFKGFKGIINKCLYKVID